jgi:4-hydroxy-tetrahydrodipicolinate synthase
MRYRRSEAKAFARDHMRGIIAAIPYPFTPDGELDEAGLRKDVRHYIDALGIDGFFCGGLVSEFWALTMEERRRGQQIVAEEAADRAQVVAHTACSSIRETVALSRHAQVVGATYVILGNPPMTSRHPDHLFEFYRRVCAELDLGVALFNTPLAGYSLSPELVARLAEIENIVAVKNPQPPEHTDETRRLAGARIIICDPAEPRWLDNILTHGDQVYNSSPAPYLLQTASRPLMREYTRQAMACQAETARATSATLEPVRAVADRWMGDEWRAGTVPIAVIKYWSELLGLTGGDPRSPLLPLCDEEKRTLRRDLAAVGLLS